MRKTYRTWMVLASASCLSLAVAATPRETAGGVERPQPHDARSLVVGKVAPEIEGEDVDGKKFKLSEYRGKVVVLDFWGDW